MYGNKSTTKYTNLSDIESILKSIDWFARYRILALISIRRLCNSTESPLNKQWLCPKMAGCVSIVEITKLFFDSVQSRWSNPWCFYSLPTATASTAAAASHVDGRRRRSLQQLPSCGSPSPPSGWVMLTFSCRGGGSKRGHPAPIFVSTKKRVFNKRAIESSAVLYGFLWHSKIFMGWALLKPGD